MCIYIERGIKTTENNKPLTELLKKNLIAAAAMMQFKVIDIKDILKELEIFMDMVSMVLKEENSNQLFLKDLAKILDNKPEKITFRIKDLEKFLNRLVYCDEIFTIDYEKVNTIYQFKRNFVFRKEIYLDYNGKASKIKENIELQGDLS